MCVGVVRQKDGGEISWRGEKKALSSTALRLKGLAIRIIKPVALMLFVSRKGLIMCSLHLLKS